MRENFDFSNLRKAPVILTLFVFLSLISYLTFFFHSGIAKRPVCSYEISMQSGEGSQEPNVGKLVGYPLLALITGEVVKTSNCPTTSLVSPSIPLTTGAKFFTNGSYIVGKEIQSGLYQVAKNDFKINCYWENSFSEQPNSKHLATASCMLGYP